VLHTREVAGSKPAAPTSGSPDGVGAFVVLEADAERTRQGIAALVLDARLPPADQRELIGVAIADLSPVDPRGQLTAALEQTATAEPDDRPARARLVRRIDETLVAGVRETHMPAFLACSALALLGRAAALPSGGPALRRSGAAATAAVAVVALPALGADRLAPEPVTIADPCDRRELPRTGGVDGFVQDVGLVAVDRAACGLRSSREELALALVDEEAGRADDAEHGFDPRSVTDLLGGIAGRGRQLEETVEDHLSRLGR
jgi:hypothetical protein